jgi:CRISPR-associated protein Cmr5
MTAPKAEEQEPTGKVGTVEKSEQATSPLQKTKEQERAAQAWKDVSGVKTKTFEGLYGGWVKKLPALILTNGLGQALAFLLAKGKRQEAAKTLYDHLSKWIMAEVAQVQGVKLLDWLIKHDSAQYRRATTEALAFVNWLKRFAEAELTIVEPERAEEGE